MKNIIIALLLLCIKVSGQTVKIQSNGGCILVTDSKENISTCGSITFNVDNQKQKVTIMSVGRQFKDYAYTQVKDKNGANIASSFTELITKLGEIQGSIIYGTAQTTPTPEPEPEPPIDVSFSCLQVTSETIYAANTYREISIAPLNYGTYKLKTGSNAENSGISNIIDLKNEFGGLITTIITVTPQNGSTLLVCTKQ